MTDSAQLPLGDSASSVGKSRDDRDRAGIGVGLARFVRFEIDQHLMRPRWLLTFPVAVFIAYMAINDVVLQSKSNGLAHNGWDALFDVFANGLNILYVFTPLLLLLVSDLLPASGMEQMALLRVASRQRWWLGKMLTLAASVLLYIAIIVGVVAALSSFALPWDTAWSAQMLHDPARFAVPPPATATPPTVAFMQLLLLLALGWFAVGLLVMLAAQLSHRSKVGFLVGVLVLLAAIAAFKMGVPWHLGHLLPHEHLLFSAHSIGATISDDPPFVASVGYWLLWIIALAILGRGVARRHDFLSARGDS